MPEVMSIEVDEEFDPTPQEPKFSFRKPDGTLNYGLIGGVAVAIVLVLVLIFAVWQPFASDPAPTPTSTWSPTDPTKNMNFLETYPADSAMVTAVQASLDSWAQYYTTAKLEDLQTTFDMIGAQYALLSSQQPQIAANLEPGYPAVVELGPVGEVKRKGNIVTVRVQNKWTKPGSDKTTTYNWDIDMKIVGNSYVLSTVNNSPAGATQPLGFCDAIGVVAGLDSFETLTTQLKKFEGEHLIAKTAEVYTVKAAAWSKLADAVAGTDSQEDVEAIVNLYSESAQAAKNAKTIDDLKKSIPQDDVSSQRKDIEKRATEECEADISNK